MPIYTIRDPETNRQIKVRGDSPPSENELEEIFSSLRDKSQWKNIASNIGQQVLPVVGAVGGAILGGGADIPTGIVPGAVVGGVGGYATGQAGADLLSRSLGVKQPIKNIPQAISETGQNIYGGLKAETLGAALPYAYQGAKALVKGTGRGFEQFSGMSAKSEGVLERAAEDASLIGAKGKKAVQELYERAKNGEQIPQDLLDQALKTDFVDKANEMANNGTLNPTSALEARKTLESIKNKYAPASYYSLKKKFDDIAKTIFKGSDEAYQRALDAEAMRNVLPQNIRGGASPFRMAEAGWLARNLGPIGVAAGSLTSPVILGTTATGLGIANRYALQPLLTNPYATLGIAANLISRQNQ